MSRRISATAASVSQWSWVNTFCANDRMRRSYVGVCSSMTRTPCCSACGNRRGSCTISPSSSGRIWVNEFMTSRRTRSSSTSMRVEFVEPAPHEHSGTGTSSATPAATAFRVQQAVDGAADAFVLAHGRQICGAELRVVGVQRAPRCVHAESDGAAAIGPRASIDMRHYIQLLLRFMQLEIQVAEHRLRRRVEHFQQCHMRVSAQVPRRAGQYPRQRRGVPPIRYAAGGAGLDAGVPDLAAPRFLDRYRRQLQRLVQREDRGATALRGGVEMTWLGSSRARRSVTNACTASDSIRYTAVSGVCRAGRAHVSCRSNRLTSVRGMSYAAAARSSVSSMSVECGATIKLRRAGKMAEIIEPLNRSKAESVHAKAQTTMYYSYMDSPIGPLLLAGSRHALKVIGFSRGDKARTRRARLGAARRTVHARKASAAGVFRRRAAHLRCSVGARRNRFSARGVARIDDDSVWHHLRLSRHRGARSITRRRFEPWVPQTARIRFRSSSRAIG